MLFFPIKTKTNLATTKEIVNKTLDDLSIKVRKELKSVETASQMT